MALSLQQLLALQQLNRIGRSKVIAIGQYAKSSPCFGAEDLHDILSQCILKKVISGVDPAGYSINTIREALINADQIIDAADKHNVSVLTYFDEKYPETLRHIVKKQSSKSIDSPAFLYVKGDVNILTSKKGIAIIGTREPTPEGILAGEYFSEKFATDGLNIVSGLAIGCDTSAHKGALKAQAGITTAFLAHGLDQVFPKENTALAAQILDTGGALVSEYPIGTPPMANYFVERDRLQSGLASGTLVIQTGVKGGTMHAVNATIENKKPLFVIQYNHSYQCGSLSQHEKVQGNILLLNEGKAKPLSRGNYASVLQEVCSYQLPIEKNIPQSEQLRF